MKEFFCSIFLLFTSFIFGQILTENYNRVFYSEKDSISMEYSLFQNQKFNLVLVPNDTISPGTNGAPDIIMKAYIGKDTLQIFHNNFPFAQKTYVTIETPKGKSVVAFRFNNINGYFSQDYIDTHLGKIEFSNPEIYELANIIWTLSPTGERATDLYKKSEYYEKVKKYFKPYLNHPLFDKLNFPDSIYSKKHYDFRENSFAFKFDNSNKIISSENYFYVMGGNYDNFNSLFKELIPLIEDFAEKSKFRKFYKRNSKYYAKQTSRLDELLPVEKMWSWLESEFPTIKIQSYKIVFSPLVGGSHSTQKYHTYDRLRQNSFFETIMFICGSERYDSNKKLSENEKTGLMSGIVFTEIDHNYVNPTSSKFQKEINTIFDKKNGWVSESEDWYTNSIAVFNEYMTHAVFCLWMLENFDIESANYVINSREELNVSKRGFVKFKEFNQELISLRKNNPSLKVTELYPLILNWCKNQ